LRGFFYLYAISILFERKAQTSEDERYLFLYRRFDEVHGDYEAIEQLGAIHFPWTTFGVAHAETMNDLRSPR
jgi:hypothetical protein